MSCPTRDLAHAKAEKARVLMLQGPSNLFFRDLGCALMARGAKVHRIGFCPGDHLYWRRDAGEITPCSASKSAYAAWIGSFLDRFRPSDIVMLGDGRFYHRETLDVVRQMAPQPRIHIVEQGLIRPGWILIENDGMGKRSRIPERFQTAPRMDAPPTIPAPAAPFLRYAALDIGYHVPGMLVGWLYNSDYQHPALVSQWVEYAGWVKKALTRGGSVRSDRTKMSMLENISGPRFLFPLQLETDYQIREHSKGKSLEDHMEDMLKSFAAFAPSDAHVIVKRHPLDNGWAPWRKRVVKLAQDIGIKGRVHYLDRGDLKRLLDLSVGVITVNSSVGLQAVLEGCPCVTLGNAVYDIKGLTAPSLDTFWASPEKPDHETSERFRAFLLTEYHVPGSFDGQGALLGANALAKRIIS